MAFIADKYSSNEEFDFIMGDTKKSLALKRYHHLEEIDSEGSIKISLRDPKTNNWTKWVPFPGLLYEINISDYGLYYSGITAAIDVHRSILDNEIIIESDYSTYEENYSAARLIGKIIENKGFKPLYYYSGNKSIHICCYFDFECIRGLDELVIDQLRTKFNHSLKTFQKKFMKWLREKMIGCWDLEIKQFDKALINPKHLIRCELSKNKKGFKTFLGYSYKDLSMIPRICNEETGIYPDIGKIKLSSPENIQGIIEEFLEEINLSSKLSKLDKNQKSLYHFNSFGDKPKRIRECIKIILNDDFKLLNDGQNRAFFILLNELREKVGDKQALIIINDWNERMGKPIKEKDIQYRFNSKIYFLPCSYIHKFLNELGYNLQKNCKQKVYK